jgi:hypothetical protein
MERNRRWVTFSVCDIRLAELAVNRSKHDRRSFYQRVWVRIV